MATTILPGFGRAEMVQLYGMRQAYLRNPNECTRLWRCAKRLGFVRWLLRQGYLSEWMS